MHVHDHVRKEAHLLHGNAILVVLSSRRFCCLCVFRGQVNMSPFFITIDYVQLELHHLKKQFIVILQEIRSYVKCG